MRIATRAVAGALLAGAVLAAPAQAQINFFTTGTFTSPGATCNGTNICSGAGFTLTYTPATLNPGLIASGSVVSLGQFSLSGTGSATAAPGVVMFTVAINQTNPTAGTANIVGSISGTVQTDVPCAGGTCDFSSLIWTPNQFATIDGTTYQVIFNNVGPAAGRGIAIPINKTTGIDALVTTTATPEPASMTLLATGLAGVFGAARRRRNAKVA